LRNSFSKLKNSEYNFNGKELLENCAIIIKIRPVPEVLLIYTTSSLSGMYTVKLRLLLKLRAAVRLTTMILDSLSDVWVKFCVVLSEINPKCGPEKDGKTVDTERMTITATTTAIIEYKINGFNFDFPWILGGTLVSVAGLLELSITIHKLIIITYFQYLNMFSILNGIYNTLGLISVRAWVSIERMKGIQYNNAHMFCHMTQRNSEIDLLWNFGSKWYNQMKNKDMKL